MIARTTKPRRCDQAPGHAAAFWCHWGAELCRRFHLTVPPADSITGQGATSQSPQTLGLRAGATSVTGDYREVNEDRYFCSARQGVFLVVDGMGGHRGGALAAQIITEVIPLYLNETLSAHQVDQVAVQAQLERAVQAARERMIKLADRDPELRQMGATMALAVVVNDALYLSHVGDCRVYLHRDGRLRRQTSDETLVQTLVDGGVLSTEESAAHPWRHVVLNAIGVRDLDSMPEVTVVALKPGDQILLASDGLTGAVDDDALCEIINRRTAPRDLARKLVERALANESRDNVTCVVAQLWSVPAADFYGTDLNAALPLQEQTQYAAA